jgi:outer membrane protein OmpA-like peptidoglycan-associated protein
MNDNPKLKILISGHTDNVGKPVDNLALSKGGLYL